MTLRIGSLFAGYGGLDQGVSSVLGGEPVWFSEFDAHPSRILAHNYPEVPNLGDITRIDWRTVEPIDVLTGGFPCQDVSHAGARAGLKKGTRTGLWSYMRDAVDVLRPRLVVAENVRGLLSADADSSVEPCPWCVGDPDTSRPMRALGAVLADLADLGYDAWWCGLRAADVGAPHGRFRVFIFAWPADAVGDAWRLLDGDGGAAGRTAPARVAGSGAAVTLFPTPRASDGEKGGPGQRGSSGDLMLPSAVALLPTPAVNDMGEGKTVEWWDEWAPRQQSSDGRPAPHGKSLAIEAQRMLPTPVTTDAKGARNSTANRRPDSTGAIGDTLGDVVYADRFGEYAPAITLWSALTRPAPEPTEPTGKDGAARLSARFVEWMMGLPEGWVTDPAIWADLKPSTARNAQLKVLGNGVVPQQAAEATRRFLAWAYDEGVAA